MLDGAPELVLAQFPERPSGPLAVRALDQALFDSHDAPVRLR